MDILIDGFIGHCDEGKHDKFYEAMIISLNGNNYLIKRYGPNGKPGKVLSEKLNNPSGVIGNLAGQKRRKGYITRRFSRQIESTGDYHSQSYWETLLLRLYEESVRPEPFNRIPASNAIENDMAEMIARFFQLEPSFKQAKSATDAPPPDYEKRYSNWGAWS